MRRTFLIKFKKSKSYTYFIEKVIGNGTFGVVYQKEEVFLNIVMEFVPENIYRLEKYFKKQKQPFPNILVKLYSYQLLRAIGYIHTIGICHRDIKPQNLLVDTKTHELKLCDFGSAKKLQKGIFIYIISIGEASIAYICSRYYRAPELILGATNYSHIIDVWSVGCVIAELLLLFPIFMGSDSTKQMIEIMKIMGTPTEKELIEMNLPNFKNLKLPKISPPPFNKVFKTNVDPLAIDLISKLLKYSPKDRLKPFESLNHPFFDEIKNKSCRINGNLLPDLFNFTKGLILLFELFRGI